MRQITIIFSVILLITSCSIERQMLNNKTKSCKIAEDICDNTDSIVRTKKIYKTKYDTMYMVDLPDEWYKKKQNISLPSSIDSINALLGYNIRDSINSDTIRVETKTSKASSYVQSGEHFIDIINKDYYKAKVTLYKDSVVNITEKYRKTKASYQYYKDKYEKNKAWKTVFAWICAILTGILLIIFLIFRSKIF